MGRALWSFQNIGWKPSICLPLSAYVMYANETKQPKDVILSVMPVRLGPKDLPHLRDVYRPAAVGRGQRSTQSRSRSLGMT
jgi:hypothetical protein